MRRRTGDAIAIDGGYQHRAITQGNAVQRFWHHTKKLVVDEFLPSEPNDLILDVGCGSGVLSDHLSKSGASVIGVDGNRDAVEFATQTYASPNLTFREGLVDESFSTERPVDKIYNFEVIEHLYPEQGVAMLRTFLGLLRIGGRVCLTTPNYRSLWPIIEWGMDRFTSAAHLDGDQHVAHYNAGLLRQTFEQAGFRVVRQATVSGIAPWVAPLSWGLAARVHAIESRAPFIPGSILVCVGERES